MPVVTAIKGQKSTRLSVKNHAFDPRLFINIQLTHSSGYKKRISNYTTRVNKTKGVVGGRNEKGWVSAIPV